jgi:predicted AlkP superfamily phosphohydrolase/phosphomutase
VNTLKAGEPNSTAPLDLYLDPESDLLKIEAGESNLILRPGEWSEWVELKFGLLKPFASATGIVRFYLKDVHPHLKLYCSPVNLSPENPALPISTPDNYSRELYDNLGNFYTLGIPEDTKALSAAYFDYAEYLSQAHLVLKERLNEFHYTFKNFKKGFYFFYFSSLDQNSHALWSTFDKGSPLYDPEIDAKYGSALSQFYFAMDEVLGEVLRDLRPEDLLLIMSDHGFAPFRFCFDLNTFLYQNGYIVLKDSTRRMEEFFPGLNWRKTKAYGLGINSLYLNLRGREPDGCVAEGKEYENLRAELIAKLTSITDEKTGAKVITSVWKREEIYHGPEVENAPDLIIGYNSGYRASWDTVLGKMPPHIISNNPDKWSGDHCIDNQWVPGVLLSNRKIDKQDPALYDLAPTILTEFGIEPSDQMISKPIFKLNPHSPAVHHQE